MKHLVESCQDCGAIPGSRQPRKAYVENVEESVSGDAKKEAAEKSIAWIVGGASLAVTFYEADT